jgi:hypothetical protein
MSEAARGPGERRKGVEDESVVRIERLRVFDAGAKALRARP